MTSQSPEGSTDNTREQLAEMKRDMAKMEAMVQQLVCATTIESFMFNGFSHLASTLTTQLQPLAALADITPKRTLMEDADSKKLARVRAELARQNWSGVETLDEPQLPGTRPRLDGSLNGPGHHHSLTSGSAS